MAVESGRPGSLINQRFFGPLPPLVEQLIELLDLKATGRSIAAGREIVSEGRPCPAIYLIAEGVAIRYRILRDGQRQIVNVLLPGDFAGISLRSTLLRTAARAAAVFAVSRGAGRTETSLFRRFAMA